VTKVWSDATDDRATAALFAEVWAAIFQLQTARTAESTSVSTGNIEVVGDGQIVSRYLSGQPAVRIGPVGSSAGPGLTHGTGLYVGGEQDQSIFWATHASDGRTEVVMGVNEHRVGRIYSKVDDYWSQTFGLHRIQTRDGAECHILSDGKLWLYTNADWRVDVNGAAFMDITSNMQIVAQGVAALGGAAGTYLQPEATGLAANVHMAADGRVYRSTSSRRYKSDIQDAAFDPDAVLQLQPRTWLPGSIPRTCPDWLHEKHSDAAHCPAEQEPELPDPDARRQVGFVAEELVDLGLSDFVEFNADNEPEAIYYDRLTAALVPLLQRQQAQIDALTEQVKQLSARVAGQEHAPEPNTTRRQ